MASRASANHLRPQGLRVQPRPSDRCERLLAGLVAVFLCLHRGFAADPLGLSHRLFQQGEHPGQLGGSFVAPVGRHARGRRRPWRPGRAESLKQVTGAGHVASLCRGWSANKWPWSRMPARPRPGRA